MEQRRMVCIREDACLFTAPTIAGKLRHYLETYSNDSTRPESSRRDALALSRAIELCNDPCADSMIPAKSASFAPAPLTAPPGGQ